MADDFIFADSPEYVWADLPGAEFVDLTDNVIRLKDLQATNVSIIYGCRLRSVSTIYGCRLIIRGKIMASRVEIYLGGGNTVDLQLTAENADTGVVAPLSAQLMAMIEQCEFACGSSIIDSTAAGLGADQPFDHITNADSGILSLSLGAQSLAPGTFKNCRLSIKFTNASLPKIINLRREVIVFPAL